MNIVNSRGVTHAVVKDLLSRSADDPLRCCSKQFKFSLSAPIFRKDKQRVPGH